MPRASPSRVTAAGLLAAALLTACAQLGPPARKPGPHDARKDFVPAPANFDFKPLADSSVATDRWSGVLSQAAHRIEVPQAWNAAVVLYAHGYAGTGKSLVVQDPPIRRYWSRTATPGPPPAPAPTTTTLRAGVEDTNALALAFNEIAERNGAPAAAREDLHLRPLHGG